MLEPCGLISLNAVSRAVSLAKRVAAEPRDEIPYFGDLAFSAATLARALGELDLDLGDEVGFVFGQGAAEDVGASRRQAGERFAGLREVFLIDDQAKAAPQTCLGRRV